MTRLQEIDNKIKEIVCDIKKIRPDVEFSGSEKSPQLVHYTVSFIKNGPVVTKNSINIYSKTIPEKIVSGKYLTEKEAMDSFNKVLPIAVNKFNTCKSALSKLTTELNFSVGFHYDGDCYGIYNEYDYISFEIDGFYFQFELI